MSEALPGAATALDVPESGVRVLSGVRGGRLPDTNTTFWDAGTLGCSRRDASGDTGIVIAWRIRVAIGDTGVASALSVEATPTCSGGGVEDVVLSDGVCLGVKVRLEAGLEVCLGMNVLVKSCRQSAQVLAVFNQSPRHSSWNAWEHGVTLITSSGSQLRRQIGHSAAYTLPSSSPKSSGS